MRKTSMAVPVVYLRLPEVLVCCDDDTKMNDTMFQMKRAPEKNIIITKSPPKKRDRSSMYSLILISVAQTKKKSFPAWYDETRQTGRQVIVVGPKCKTKMIDARIS